MRHMPHGSRHALARSLPAILWGLGSMAILAWLTGGCASPRVGSYAPKPGRGIAEYRALVREAHQAVAATVQALEALAQPNTRTSPHPALPGFDRALHQLEVTSVKSRARAEAIIARGQAYFDEWKENLSGITNRALAQAETNRYARLLEHFARVRQRSGEVREEFRPFMNKLREYRARLDRPSTASIPATGSETVKQQLEAVTASGKRVLQTLEAVSTALDAAEAEVRAMQASAPGKESSP